MRRVIRGIVAAVVLAMLGASALAVVELAGRVGRPFAGFVFLANGDVGPRLLTLPRAGAEVARLRPQDRLVAIDGVPIRNGREALAAIERAASGSELRYTFLRSGRETFELRIPVATFTWHDAGRLFFPFLAGGLLLAGLAAVVGGLRPGDPVARVLWVFATSAAATFGVLLVDGFLGYRFGATLQLIGLALAKASLLHVALLWPIRRWPLTRWPRLAPAFLYGAMGLHALAYRVAYFDAPIVTTVLAHVSVATFVAAVAAFVANIAQAAWRSSNARLQRASRVVLVGPALGVAVGPVLFATTWGWSDLALPPLFFLLPIWVTIAVFSYAILKHNLFEIDAMARRVFAMAIQGLVVAGAYLAVLRGVDGWFGEATAWTAATLFAAALLVAIPAFGPLRRRAECLAAALFPRQRRAAATARRALRELARLRDENALATALREAIAAFARSERVHILVGRPGASLRECGAEAGAPALGADANSALLAATVQGSTVDLEDRRTGASRELRQQLEKLGVSLFVPLPPGQSVVGALLLGARADGRLYTREDKQLLETLAAQSTAAFENARAWEEVRALQGRLARENVYLRQELELSKDFGEIVGRSPGMRDALAQVERVAPTDATVLVLGETGTGKELVVGAVHALSRRRDRVLVKVACAAIPETLIESELFGHERGAFTGATQAKAGRFEVADGGTLFFDDVDTLPLAVQAKLLRAIQEGESQRVGSNQVRHVDVRIVAATNKDLRAEVEAGRFREDLYYRLHVVPIRIPPLRERASDIPALVQHFIDREAGKLGREIRSIAAEALEQLCTYPWPGNVRELRNVIERALVLTQGDVLRLPGPLFSAPAPAPARGAGGDDPEVGELPLAEMLRRKKIEWIRRALALAGGNQRAAAELLGLHRPSLTRMIREALGLHSPVGAGGAGEPAALVGRA